MRRFLSVLLAASLWLSSAWAGPWQAGPGEVFNPTVAASYTGPGDITAFTEWESCTRAYSDNATCTVKVAANGNLDLLGTPCGGSTVAVWIGVSSATVSKAYDQKAGNACNSASCDHVQATAANQPAFLLTGCGVTSLLPCI
jgi:hypothetical protein